MHRLSMEKKSTFSKSLNQPEQSMLEWLQENGQAPLEDSIEDPFDLLG